MFIPFLHENISILCDLWWGMESSQWFQLWFILPAAPCLLMSVAHTGSYWLEISHTDTVLCSCLWSIYPFSLEISNMDTILSRDLGVWNFHPSLQKLGGIIRNTICFLAAFWLGTLWSHPVHGQMLSSITDFYPVEVATPQSWEQNCLALVIMLERTQSSGSQAWGSRV